MKHDALIPEVTIVTREDKTRGVPRQFSKRSSRTAQSGWLIRMSERVKCCELRGYASDGLIIAE